MIDEIKFSLKTFAISILLLLLLQFRVGDQTIENKLVSYAQGSQVVGFAETAAIGMVQITKEVIEFSVSEVKKLWGQSPKGQSSK